MPQPPRRARKGNYAYAPGLPAPMRRPCPECEMPAGERCVQYARDALGVSYIRRTMSSFHAARRKAQPAEPGQE